MGFWQSLLIKKQILKNSAFIWNSENSILDTIIDINSIDLKLLVAIDKQKNRSNFRALNVHYLFPRFRYELIGRLLREGTNKLRITRTLNKFLRYADGEDAGVITKTYLYNKCRSRFLEIPPEEWELACALPMENFRKEHKTKAWFDTREKLQ